MESSQDKGGPNGLVLIAVVGVLMGAFMALLTFTGNDILQTATGTSADRIPTPAPDIVRAGQPAPAFTLETPDGRSVALEDFRGQVVAINFWATWCAPCRDEMPALQRASEEHEDFVILAVNTGESPSRVEAFMRDLGLTFTALLDPREEITDLYAVSAMPTTVWVDAEGVVQFEHFGPLTESQIDRYIETVTSTNPPNP